jgi:hypothetical protein
MAFANGRLVLRGTITGGQSWSVGFHFQNDAVADSAALNAWLTSINAAVTTALNPIIDLWATDTDCFGLTAYYVDTATDKVISGAEQNLTTPVTGSSSVRHPGQSCIVASLRTPFLGAQFRGRLYWPLTGLGLLGGLIVDITDCTTLAEATANLLNIINDSTLAGTSPSATTRGNSATDPTGISSVVVDQVPDTQRRRRDKITGGAAVALI